MCVCVCERAYVCNVSVLTYSCAQLYTSRVVCYYIRDRKQKNILLYRVSIHSNYIVELHYVSLLSVYSNKQGGVAIIEIVKSTVTC